MARNPLRAVPRRAAECPPYLMSSSRSNVEMRPVEGGISSLAISRFGVRAGNEVFDQLCTLFVLNDE